MKRKLVIIAAILTVQMTFAQHYIGVGASVSSPIQLDKSAATKPLIGWGEGVTLQYQYRRGHFLLSIGAAVSGEHPRVSVADETFDPRMMDTRGIEFNYLGSLKSRSDLSSTLWFHTPVMIGFETYPFYMMVGAQYSLFLTSSEFRQDDSRSYRDVEAFGCLYVFGIRGDTYGVCDERSDGVRDAVSFVAHDDDSRAFAAYCIHIFAV
jgi:hypothetical protein